MSGMSGYGCSFLRLVNIEKGTKYRGSPDSTNFGLPGNRTIAKIVLSGD